MLARKLLNAMSNNREIVHYRLELLLQRANVIGLYRRCCRR
jgi:hypothetical protein